MSNSNPLTAAEPPVALSTINVVLDSEPDYEAIVSETRVPRLRRTDYDGLVYEPGTTALMAAPSVLSRARSVLSRARSVLSRAPSVPTRVPLTMIRVPVATLSAPSNKGPKTSRWPSAFD